MCNANQIYNSITERCIQNTARNRTRIQNSTKNKKPLKQDPPPSKSRQKCILLCENFCRENVIGDGDCEFHSIAKIINSVLDHESKITTADLRLICSKMMRDKEYISNKELRILRVAYKEDRADESWTHRSDMDVISIRRYRKRVSRAILSQGFWGDQVTLNMLSYHFRINFWVINRNCNIVHTTPPSTRNIHAPLALLHLHDMHYSPLRLKSNHPEYILNVQSPTVKEILNQLLQMRKTPNKTR